MEFNLAQLQEAVGQAIPERDCIIQGERRLNCGDLTERTRRLANFLGSRGLGATRPRSELSGWESGQDHVGLYLRNSPEYLEGMLEPKKVPVSPLLREALWKHWQLHRQWVPNGAEWAFILWGFAVTPATRYQTRSMMVPVPRPPPQHIAIRP